MTNNSYKRINWTDGMIVESRHFAELENYIIRQDENLARLALNDTNYGLLPLKDPENDFKTELTIDGNKLVISQIKCLAVTRSGHLIDLFLPDFNDQVFDGENSFNVIDLSEFSDGEFDLVVKINPYERVPFGEISSDEVPLRRPYVIPGYEFILNPRQGDISKSSFGDRHIAIKRFKLSAGKITTVNFIPPCVSLRSNINLINLHEEFIQSAKRMEAKMIDFLFSSNAHLPVFKDMVSNLLNVLIMNESRIKSILLNSSPVELFNIIFTLAIAGKKTPVLDDSHRYANMVSDVKHQFNNIDLNALKYDHTRIFDMFTLSNTILTTITNVLNIIEQKPAGNQPRNEVSIDIIT